MSVSATSTKQFGSLFSEGGFSTDSAGRSPSSGYMVALQGSERSISAPLLHPEHLDAYKGDHAQQLGRSGHFMGGWHDTDRGAVDLDVSVNLPSSGGIMDWAKSRTAMITHGQRSLYNVDTGMVEANDYYGKTKPEAHAEIKRRYESAAGPHR